MHIPTEQVFLAGPPNFRDLSLSPWDLETKGFSFIAKCIFSHLQGFQRLQEITNIVSKVKVSIVSYCLLLLQNRLWLIDILITQTMEVLNSFGARTQPCLIPEYTGKEVSK